MTGLLYCAALLALAVALLIILTGRLRLHATLALAGLVVAYGFAADMTISSIGRTFSIGFVHTLDQVGLVLLGGIVAAVFVERSGAAVRIAAALARRGASSRIAVPIGLVAGTGASPTAALALALPLVRALRGRSGLVLSLSLLASFALVPPSPIAIAGSAVLGADAMTVFIVGAPLAIVVAMAGWLYAGRALPRVDDSDAEITTEPMHARDLLAVVLPVLVPLALLIVQSVAQIPSEPLGRGGMRELFTGISRPLMLMVLAAGLALLLVGRWDAAALSERGWAGEAITAAAGALMVMGAAGGFGRVLDETGAAELLGEALSLKRWGVLTPFLVAAIVKTMLGSSLTATLTTAGMIEPLLPALGLDAPTGRALAVAAIGAGAMTVSHINDAHFWLTAHAQRITPARALLAFSGGTAAQGVLAIAILLILSKVLL
ncbi:MAG: GntP family permease [Alphaproteobacteria bacterium]|nr:GntP family permease [Alphaproteobacteria bacterium]MCW5741401.1 GntP family permease [Alphaproteobacteria bacterium]